MSDQALNPYCIFCGAKLSPTAGIHSCDSCGLRACGECFAKGNDTCPGCGATLSASDGSSRPAASARKQQSQTGGEAGSTAVSGGFGVGLHSVDTNGWQTWRGYTSRFWGPRLVLAIVVLILIAAIALGAVGVSYLSRTQRWFMPRHYYSFQPAVRGPNRLKIVASTAPVRSTPQKGSTIVFTLRRDSVVGKLGWVNSYYHIIAGSREGWIHQNYVLEVSPYTPLAVTMKSPGAAGQRKGSAV